MFEPINMELDFTTEMWRQWEVEHLMSIPEGLLDKQEETTETA